MFIAKYLIKLYLCLHNLSSMDGVIIQARLGSTRLPNKIVLDFYDGQRIIDIIIECIKTACPCAAIVLATTTNERDNLLQTIAEEHGIKVFRGSEDNVLDRFICAAEEFDIDTLIRVCSDNPFLQAETFSTLFEAYRQQPADYFSYAFTDGTPAIKTHLGLFAELTTLHTLKQVAAASQDKLTTEHVTHYIYTHPDKYNVQLLPMPKLLEGRRDLRFTTDTQDDFELMQQLYALHRTSSLEQVIAYVDTHPNIKARMCNNISLNSK